MTNYPTPQTRRTTRNKAIILSAWGDAMIEHLAVRHSRNFDLASFQRTRRVADQHMERFTRYADALRKVQ